MGKHMSVLPNCPQIKNGDTCPMDDGTRCKRMRSCDTICPNESSFIASSPYVYEESCSGKKVKHTAKFNFYRLSNGTECFTEH